MEELLKVSIIVPVHNAVRTLGRCIDSIIFQSYKNVECILIENDSNDNSAALCSCYAEKYRNVVAESIELKGVSNARNKGLSLATGDIVGFCDADDFLEMNAVETVVREFLKNRNVISVFGGFNIGRIDGEKNIVKKYNGLKEQEVSISKALQLLIINDAVMGSVWNKYYRRDVLERASFDCSLSFCEDMHFNAKVLDAIRSEKKVKIVSVPLYCYMENVESATHNKNMLFDDKDELKYIVALKKIETDCKLDKKIKNLLKMKIACFSIDSLMSMEIDDVKRKNLVYELNKNYIYLVCNLWKNNWKWNIKRIYKGVRYLYKYTR